MANIRMISDLKKENENTPLVQNNGNPTPQRYDDSYSSLNIIQNIFPNFSFKSPLFIISISQIFLYIATLIYGSTSPLIPSAKSLMFFGGNYPPLIVKGQIWRLICAAFLHASFIHIFFNLFFQLRMGFNIENTLKFKKFLSLYFITAIAGNLFSALAQFCLLKVGASTSGYGMIGYELSQLVLFWNIISYREQLIAHLIIYFMMTFFLIFSMNGSQIDQMGHLGGLIAGFCLGIIFSSEIDNKPRWYNALNKICLGFLILFFCAGFPILFLLSHKC